jgi:response regulator RpfG family c-di-GMP phosphodiesterase
MLNEPKKHVVVVDDEQYICRIIVESLGDEFYDIVAFSNPTEALEHIGRNPVDLVLTDLVMGEHSGMQMIETTLENHPDAVVILMTAHPTVQTAIQVLKRGAYDFLVKPFKLELLNATIRRGLNHQNILRDNLQLKGQVEFLKVANAFFGTGQALDKYLGLLLRSCNTELSANCSAVIEIDPTTGDIIRRVSKTEQDCPADDVLDESLVEHFRQTGQKDARVVSQPVTIDGRQMHRILISNPVYVRNVLHGVINVQLVSRAERVPHGQIDALSILASSAASAMANERLYQDLQSSYLNAIRALANAIDARDRYTAGHTDRVIRLAEIVAHAMGWSKKQIFALQMGCTLHDIGKIGVPDAILNKNGRLDEQETGVMKNHPKVGLQIIDGIEIFKPSIPYIIAHHERFDGTGYPERLKGDDIPVEGRLLAVVDTFDAIMSDRPYRKGAELTFAVKELQDNSGTQFDPDLVDIFLDLLRTGQVSLPSLYGREYDLSCLFPAPVTETVSG